MRLGLRMVRLGLALAALAGSQVALAGECNDPEALGVARVQEIDTSQGGGYGRFQFAAESTFLADKEVVLTFDDGPSPSVTPAILEALDAECVKATFFAVGQMALANPDLLREVDRRGHTIAAHTFSHHNLARLEPARSSSDIETGFSTLQSVLGHPIAPFFRFPYLLARQGTLDYLAARRLAVLSIDVDSLDTHFRLAPAIVSGTMARLRHLGRGIILMHDIKRETAKALPELLRRLKQEGYKVVHMVGSRPAETIEAYDQVAAEMLAARNASVLLANLATRGPLLQQVAFADSPSIGQLASLSYLDMNVAALAPPSALDRQTAGVAPLMSLGQVAGLDRPKRQQARLTKSARSRVLRTARLGQRSKVRRQGTAYGRKVAAKLRLKRAAFVGSRTLAKPAKRTGKASRQKLARSGGKRTVKARI